MTIAIGVWPGWCICGWNVDAARQALVQQRWLPAFIVLFVEIAIVGVAAARALFRISANVPSMLDWKLLAFLVAPIVAAAWYGYHRTRWYAEALECVQEALSDDDIAWSGASPDWKPEAELLQPVPRSVRGADLKNLKSIVVIFGFISAGIVVEGYLHAGPQALGGQLYPSKAWAIASGIMLLMTTIYFLVSKIYRREADLLRRGHVVPALVTKVKEHIETDGHTLTVYWVWLSPSGERVRHLTSASDFTVLPQAGQIISVLYDPDDPTYCKPYAAVSPMLKGAKARDFPDYKSLFR